MLISPQDFQKNLLNWYMQFQRVLPWRAISPELPNPYHVFLSEIMLQQTTVPTVIRYFDLFITKWPRIQDLAQATLDEILHAWQGLGYYARARNLHKCAQVITQTHAGVFPQEEEELHQLPGIGPYTAAAISAIAFGKASVVVDGNIERIMSRVFAIEDPLPRSKSLIKEKAAFLTPFHQPGEYAQALMDLGSSICRPKVPLCQECPLHKFCLASHQNRASLYPKFLPKVKKPEKYATVFWVQNQKGQVLIQRRPEKGLLGGMMEIPSSMWQDQKNSQKVVLSEAPFPLEWQEKSGIIKHTFTHFHLYLNVVCGVVTEHHPGLWVYPQDFHHYAFPTLMQKVIRHVQRDKVIP